MTAKRVLIAIGVVLVSFVAHGLIWSPRPSQSEKDTVAVVRAGDQFTLEEVADAWAQRKLGNTGPLEEILKTFPFPLREVREGGDGIVLTFEGHDETCIHFRISPSQRSSNYLCPALSTRRPFALSGQRAFSAPSRGRSKAT